jgi:hypothetical protein
MTTHARKAAKPARIVHHVEGRMRIKVMGVAGEAEFFAAVQQVIGSLSGVESVRVNPTSSSIVIDYSPADTVFHFRLQQNPEVSSWLSLDGEDALLAAIDESVTASARYLGHHSRLAETLVSATEQVDAGLREVSDGYLDLKLLFPMGVAVFTSLHKARGRGTPMWLSLGTFAFNTFLTLHRQRIDTPVIQILSRSARHG